MLYNEDGFTLKNSLFGAVKLTKIDDADKCYYSGYGILFGIRRTFSLSSSSGFDKKWKYFKRILS